MARVLVVEESAIVRGVFEKLLRECEIFTYDIATSYEDAKLFLEKQQYEYAIVEHILSDAPKGEIIALCNKHEIAPLLFTQTIDEQFFESFEGAKIIDYVIKQKYNNVTNVLERLKQIEQNKSNTIAILSKNLLFAKYLTQNLNLHGFEVLSLQDEHALFEMLHQEKQPALLLMDEADLRENSFEIVENIRKVKSSKEIKILALFEESNTYAVSRLLNSGVDDYLIKPFSRTEFYVRVYQNIN